METKTRPFKWAPLPTLFTRPSPHTVPLNKTIAYYLSSNPSANSSEPEHPTSWLKGNSITYKRHSEDAETMDYIQGERKS